MFCTPMLSQRSRRTLQVHTVVNPPLTNVNKGKIVCRAMGVAPMDFVWYGPEGREVQTGNGGEEVYGVEAGKYRVVVTDSAGQSADLTLDVEAMFPSALLVEEYKVTNASSSLSRDGCVEAVGQGLNDGWTFLWTHGVQTEGPILRDVQCGIYSLVPLPKQGKVPTVVHKCAPARVGVESLAVL